MNFSIGDSTAGAAIKQSAASNYLLLKGRVNDQSQALPRNVSLSHVSASMANYSDTGAMAMANPSSLYGGGQASGNSSRKNFGGNHLSLSATNRHGHTKDWKVRRR